MRIRFVLTSQASATPQGSANRYTHVQREP